MGAIEAPAQKRIPERHRSCTGARVGAHCRRARAAHRSAHRHVVRRAMDRRGRADLLAGWRSPAVVRSQRGFPDTVQSVARHQPALTATAEPASRDERKEGRSRARCGATSWLARRGLPLPPRHRRVPARPSRDGDAQDPEGERELPQGSVAHLSHGPDGAHTVMNLSDAAMRYVMLAAVADRR